MSLLLPLSLLIHFLSGVATADPISYLIDCGSSTNSTTQHGHHTQTWLFDRYFSGGSQATVAEPHIFFNPQERTLRFFSPTVSGKKNCYSIPAVPGRYHLRLFTVYDNYDSKRNPPEFDVSVESVVVFGWRRPWPDRVARFGAYSDLFVFVDDGSADVCFFSVSGNAPVVGSVELNGVDPSCYDSTSLGLDQVLVNYGRLTCGSELLVGDGDPYARIWQSDAAFLSSKVKTISTTRPIRNTDVSPNYFPSRLYQTAITAVTTDAAVEYSMPVDIEMDYVIWFHFAEIDPAVTRIGQRVFDVMIDRINVTRIDIFKEVGGFAAFQWRYVVKNLMTMPLSVRLVPVAGMPLICGIENYALVQVEPSTIPNQVIVMKALKESLQIPERMGWNGDPCAPSSWDAWEGVTCHHTPDGLNFVVTELALNSQGLKGYITDKIHLLSNLVSLNLSSNFLHGTLPSHIGQESLVQLDLSGNQLSGSIPDGISSSRLKLVLLNNNELKGQVPVELYEIGARGGAIDLSGNKGLCGVPSLPACSFFAGKGKFITRTNLIIGSSCIAIVFLIFIVTCFLCKGRRNGYDFVDQDPTSISSKRDRYRRQKSLMHLEMETQNSL